MRINKTLLFMIFSLAAAVCMYWGLRGGVLTKNDSINILVMGIDTPSGWEARSDSLNLVHIDFENNRIGILAIPRDTLVDIPGHGEDKINHAHMFGGPELSCLTVSRFLNIPIDYYVEVNFPLFMNLVDQIGGVTLNVEKPLYYDDYAADLHVNLQPGVQKLNGYQAMGYVRFRHDNASDWGRIDRQHKFFQAIAQQVMQPSNIWRLPSILYDVSTNVRTNIGSIKSIEVAMKASNIFRYGRVDQGVISGSDAMIDRGYYMQSDKVGMHREINRVIFGM